MAKLTHDRIAGLVAGIFLANSVALLASALGLLVTMQLTGMGITGALWSFGFALPPAMAAYGYFFYSDKRWLHIVVLTILLIGCLGSLCMITVGLFIHSETTTALQSAGRLGAFLGFVRTFLMDLFLATLVYFLLSGGKRREPAAEAKERA